LSKQLTGKSGRRTNLRHGAPYGRRREKRGGRARGKNQDGEKDDYLWSKLFD